MVAVIKIDDTEVQALLAQLADRISNRQPVMKAIGAIIRESVRTNFHEGGRPVKWKPSKRGNADKVPGRTAGTLRDTGRLMNSITLIADNNRVVVGTNVEYAAVHQFGAKKFSFGTVAAQVKGHVRVWRGKNVQVKPHQRRMKLPWGDIPARPFMLVQDEDLLDIKEVLEKYITGGTATK